jgi:hypothetical protein
MRRVQITSRFWLDQVILQGGDFRIVWSTIIAG